MDGRTTVLKAGRQFVRLAENLLEGPLVATPAVVDHSVFLRTDSYLWCVSSEATIELKNSQGLRWQLEKRGGRWTLGTLFVHDKPVDAPLASGIVALSSRHQPAGLLAGSDRSQAVGRAVRPLHGQREDWRRVVPLRGGCVVEGGRARSHARTPLVGRQGSQWI